MKSLFSKLAALGLSFAISGCAHLPEIDTSFISDAAAGIGEATGNGTLKKAFSDLTPRQEYYLGRSIAAEVLAKQPAIANEDLATYVNVMGRYLSLHSSRPSVFSDYQFTVVSSSSPTAMSAPGGYVFISEGMLKLADSEDEIAAVLAHEIAHVALKHAETTIKRAKRLELGAEAVSAAIASSESGSISASDLKVFGKIVTSLVDMKFSSGEESAADAEAVRILSRSGYKAQALESILSRMKDSKGFLDRHPSSEARVGALKKLTASRQPASESGFARRKTRFERAKSAIK